MENKTRCDDLMGHVIDPQNLIREMPAEKVRLLLVDLDAVMDDYSREIAIVYICSNYSSKKHLCSTILKGKHDHEIRDAVTGIRKILTEELERRRSV